jgi:hypothetical protein
MEVPVHYIDSAYFILDESVPIRPSWHSVHTLLTPRYHGGTSTLYRQRLFYFG